MDPLEGEQKGKSVDKFCVIIWAHPSGVGEQVTTEEQYAAIGKAHADLKAAKEKLRALHLKADEWGKELVQVGQRLQGAPQLAGLNGESPMPINLVPPGHACNFDRKIFDADKFRDLTQDIRDTMVLIENLEHKLA